MTSQPRWAPFVVGGAFLLLLLGAWEYLGTREGSALAAVLPPPSHFLETALASGFRIGLGSQAVPVYQSVMSTFARCSPEWASPSSRRSLPARP
jgi:NitT/TauT family transport system permease protein